MLFFRLLRRRDHSSRNEHGPPLYGDWTTGSRSTSQVAFDALAIADAFTSGNDWLLVAGFAEYLNQIHSLSGSALQQAQTELAQDLLSDLVFRGGTV
jgi:hypothetical protein